MSIEQQPIEVSSPKTQKRERLFLRPVPITLALVAVLSISGAWYMHSLTPRDDTPKLQVALIAPIATTSEVQISTSTSQRLLNTLTIKNAIPATGKFIAADLVGMKLQLYQDGQEVTEYPILTKGRPGTPFETPSGFYQVLTKEQNHLSTIGNVYMPYSMQFYGNYFIHGWPYYPDGTPVATSYSGGCIRLSTEDAAKVFAFADRGTKLFVYDTVPTDPLPMLSLAAVPVPDVSAQSYLVADIDTGEVYADKNPTQQWPMASITKLMTALVANETISFERNIAISYGNLKYPQVASSTHTESVAVGKLFYPLLMESNNAVANTLAASYGKNGFVSWMNSTATSLDMASTTYADPSGESAENISTTEDLYRLAVYLVNKKSFIFKISSLPSYTLTTLSGATFPLRNFNVFSGDPTFIGGKVGQTTAAGDTMVSAFSIPLQGGPRRVAIIVLQSKDYGSDTKALESWFSAASSQGGVPGQAACASCVGTSARRVIQL
jgi:D-alanyl-D-alanine carboxypeptidase (penicillin-binding protein 5/6)